MKKKTSTEITAGRGTLVYPTDERDVDGMEMRVIITRDETCELIDVHLTTQVYPTSTRTGQDLLDEAIDALNETMRKFFTENGAK